ncbi:SseB family protein [Solicola sp. PLA-1-18]|uniref:SseB family protein n=1 Tax=Solicola sp. PLA-1-18 TaxID=3380532 RepID=UPI003B7C0156
MPSLAQPAFPDDDGSADPALSAALAARAQDGTAPVLVALGDARVIVPVVALLGDTPAPGQGDKDAEMAAVLLTGADGRRALLAFSSLATLQRWDPKARPVPVPARQACAAARQEGAAAVVVDVAGPHMAVVEGDDLAHLADGSTLVPTAHGHGWVRR